MKANKQVYPLTPCLHRPTFVANLAARLDKTDPVFFALVLTVLASTLVQVPRHLVNLEKAEIESLARRCVRVSRAKMSLLWEVSTSFRDNLRVLMGRNRTWFRVLSVSTLIRPSRFRHTDIHSRDLISVRLDPSVAVPLTVSVKVLCTFCWAIIPPTSLRLLWRTSLH